MGSRQTKPQLVISLDVGSFASGYIVLHYKDYVKNRNNPNMYVNKAWAGIQSMDDTKTKTALLIMDEDDPTKDLFGHEAIETYCGADHDTRQQLRFFERFKMQLLQRQRPIDRDTMIEDSNGMHLSAITVFSRFLKCLKNHAVNGVQREDPSLSETSIKWVITVPAIWPEQAKSLMRLAARKADIPGANAVIAFEPECAAIHAIRTQVGSISLSGKVLKCPGSVFMLVDMGGGTVDVVLLEVIDKYQKMKHVLAPDGGPWGGNNVDEKFFEMLKNVVGEDVFSQFEKENSLEFLDLHQEFEYEKRKVRHNTDPDARKFHFRIPAGLVQLWTYQRGKGMPDIVKNLTVHGRQLEWIASRLVFPPEVMWSIFKETTDQTIGCIRRYIATVDPLKISAIIAVGGLSCSHYVIQALKTDLLDLGIPIIQPWDADLAVLKGAALFGYDEHSIVSRNMAFTYGLSCMKTFDKNKHNVQHIVKHNDDILANAVFQKIVTRGQTVKCSDWIDANVYFPNDGSNFITIHVHASLDENPIHITEESCWCVGKVDIDCSTFDNDRSASDDDISMSLNDLKKKAIRVSMKFGGTEITVKAVHLASGKCTISKLVLP